MEIRSKSKWQIRLAVLTLLVIGFAAGVLATNFYHTRHLASSSQTRGNRFERVFEKLDLTAEQRDQVKTIFDDARAELAEIRKESEPKFSEVRKQTDEKLQAVLTPEQWQQFQQMMSESKRRRPFKRDKLAPRP